MSARRPLAALLLAAGAAALVTLPTTTAGADPGAHDRAGTRGLVAEIRKATAQYRDVSAAVVAGYQPVSGCETLPGVGGMGIHYMNPAFARPGSVEPATPAVLLYAPGKDGRLELVGVEYFQPDVGQDRPMLGGEPFEGPMPGHGPQMPVHYDLHVWTERANPAGVFATWNPRVTC